MALFRRKSHVCYENGVATSTGRESRTIDQAMAELADVVEGTTDGRSRLSFRRDGRKLTVVPQSDAMLVLHIPASSAIVLSLRLPRTPGHGLEPQAERDGVPICWRSDGQFSPATWLQKDRNRDALKAVPLSDSEYLYAYRNGLDMRMRPRAGRDLLNRIDAALNVLRVLPPEAAAPTFKSSAVPEELRPLRALALKWGIADDEDRSTAVGEATRAQLVRLVAKVEPLLPAIDAYLQQDDTSEEALMLGDLAQAAAEARFHIQI